MFEKDYRIKRPLAEEIIGFHPLAGKSLKKDPASVNRPSLDLACFHPLAGKSLKKLTKLLPAPLLRLKGFHPLAGKSLKKSKIPPSGVVARTPFPSPCGEKFEKAFAFEKNERGVLVVSIPLRGKV